MSVHQFPSLIVRGPNVPFDTAQRVMAAYRLVEQAEEHLRLPGQSDSGVKIILREGAMALAARVGANEAGRWLAALAAEVSGEPKGAA